MKTELKNTEGLDERFLDSPSFAIQLCKNAVIKMAEYSKKAVLLAMEVQTEYSSEKVAEVIQLEQLVDQFEDSIGTYLVKLAGKDLSMDDSHLLSVLLHCISDFERISDHAINITEAVDKLQKHRQPRHHPAAASGVLCRCRQGCGRRQTSQPRQERHRGIEQKTKQSRNCPIKKDVDNLAIWCIISLN